MNEPTDRLTEPTRRHPWYAIVAIVLLAAAFRLVALDRVPPSISQDEAINAYDADCIRFTGMDHWEKPWPIFLKSFGDFHPSPPAYLQIPFQILIGMNEWSARMPDALFGVAQVLVVYLLVARFYNPRAGLWAATLLAVSPWHVHLSRLAFGIVISTSLITIAVFAIMRALDRPDDHHRSTGRNAASILGLVAAGMGLGLAFWTYHAMRVVVPLLIVGGLILAFKQLKSSLKSSAGQIRLVAFTVGFAIGLAPFIWAWIETPDEVWARASERSLFHQTSGFVDAAGKMLRNYAVHFSPSFLFKEGDLSLMQSVPGYGQLHHLYAILLPLGLFRVLRRWRTERFGLFVFWWILIAPIPASLTMLDFDSGHGLRSAGIFPAYDMLAAIGLDMVLNSAKRRSRKAFHWINATAVVAMALGAAYFAYIFFVRYPVAASRDYLAEWKPVIQEIQRRQTDYDAVMITSKSSSHIGILHLFHGRIDPKSFFDEPRTYWRLPDSDFLARWGKFYYASIEMLPKVLELLPPKARILVAERPGYKVPGRELMQFRDLNGRLVVVLYEINAEVRRDQPTSRPD